MSIIFDAVIGNPPYQDPNEKVRSNPLWSRFTLLNFSLVREGGWLTLITPPLWMSGIDEQSPKKKKELVNIFFGNKLIYVRTNAGSFFPGVGTKAASYLVQKNRRQNATTSFLTDDACFTLDISQIEMLPLYNLTPQILSIFKKIFYSGRPLCGFSSEGCISTKDINYSSGTGAYRIYNSKKVMVYTDVKPRNMFSKKLIVSLPGRLDPFYDPGICGLSVNCRWIEVQSECEAEAYIRALESPLFKLLFASYKYNGFNNTWMIKHFPIIVPFSSLTDLYQQFDLSSEDLEYINNNESSS